MNELRMRNFPVLVLYALAEMQIGIAARRCVAAFRTRNGVHLVML